MGSNPRSSAISTFGIAAILLGAWAGIVVFVGPLFGYAVDTRGTAPQPRQSGGSEPRAWTPSGSSRSCLCRRCTYPGSDRDEFGS